MNHPHADRLSAAAHQALMQININACKHEQNLINTMA
jgi:hypothetical protein